MLASAPNWEGGRRQLTNDFLILGSSGDRIFLTAQNYVAELFARACSELKKKNQNPDKFLEDVFVAHH